MRARFADRVIERARALGHPLCLGLDPYLDRIPEPFRRGSLQPADPRTSDAIAEFLQAVLDLAASQLCAVKPQIALFEQCGWRGLRALETVVGRARERGVAVLLDAKRGDIGATARGYAKGYLSADAALPVDAITVNPYPGPDTLEPFFAEAEATGRGVFVLVRTSNPGSGTFQAIESEGRPLFEHVARSLYAAERRLLCPQTGWSSLGVVVAATQAGDAPRVREALPRALFLVPGYGAQGGSAKDAVRGFVQGPAGLEGGLVNASRSVLFPPDAGASAASWEGALRAALRAAIDELADAVR
jgi:orotidine-5'-phosphate decarboxylase